MYSPDYSTLVYQKTGYRPDELVQTWDALVQSIEEGYNDVEPELDNDLDLRDQIDSVFADKDLLPFSLDQAQLSTEIAPIDARLRPLIFDNPKYSNRADKKWWHLIILKKGRLRYYQEILLLYGIRIELVNG